MVITRWRQVTMSGASSPADGHHDWTQVGRQGPRPVRDTPRMSFPEVSGD